LLRDIVSLYCENLRKCIYCVDKTLGHGILNEQSTPGGQVIQLLWWRTFPTTLFSLDCVSPTNSYVTCSDVTKHTGVSINLVRVCNIFSRGHEHSSCLTQPPRTVTEVNLGCLHPTSYWRATCASGSAELRHARVSLKRDFHCTLSYSQVSSCSRNSQHCTGRGSSLPCSRDHDATFCQNCKFITARHWTLTCARRTHF
jgi:hypothetical protein